MTVLALINPQSLLGEEIKRDLGRRKGLASEVRLLATEAEQIGAVTDFAGVAALVQECSAESFSGVDLAILLPGLGASPRKPSGLPPRTILLVVDSSAQWHKGVPVVAGLDSVQIEERSAKVLISPSPMVILLAHLLQPLKQLGPSSVVAQVLLPASRHQQAGLDELFGQTRAILSMRDDRPTAVFGKQIAFNLLPIETDSSGYLQQLKSLVGDESAVALQFVQAGVFHSLACSLFIQFERDPGLPALREVWAAHPWIEIVESDDPLGPTDAAAREEILVSNLIPSPTRPGGYQLWAVMDNLTRGGASNVIEVIESLFAITS